MTMTQTDSFQIFKSDQTEEQIKTCLEGKGLIVHSVDFTNSTKEWANITYTEDGMYRSEIDNIDGYIEGTISNTSDLINLLLRNSKC